MAKGHVTIEGLLDGRQTTEQQGGATQFLFSLGIDPDLSGNGTSSMPSGVIRPAPYAQFSSTVYNGSGIAIITNPKDEKVYVVLTNGDLVSYSSTLGSETLVGTVTGAAAFGGFYYNNYIYIPTGTDISRYGPLDGTPALTNGVWTGATLGSQTALTNTSYPSASGGVIYPNHWGHVHIDGAAYFCDFKDGQGLIHKIKTTKGTAEGDTDDGSSYNVLDLPFGYVPMDLESYGTDLMISAIQTTSNQINQGPPALFIWDTTDEDSFYRQVDLQEYSHVTALKNKGGKMYVFSGSNRGGHSVGIFDGAYGVDPIEFISEGLPPMQGAVDVFGNRISWGITLEYPSEKPVVLSLGYKSPRLNPQALHNTVSIENISTNPAISALKYVQLSDGEKPRLIIASRSGTGGSTSFQLDKLDDTVPSVPQSSLIEFGPYNIGQPFKITKVRIPLDDVVDSDVSITPKLLIDDNSKTYTLSQINNTNYSGERNIVYKTPELSATVSTVQAQGEHNFTLQLTFSSTKAISVVFPIFIEFETLSD